MAMKHTWTYEAWVAEQVATILCQIKPLAMAGRYDAADCFPSKGAAPGYLSVCEEQPEGASDVVRFGPHGCRIMSISCVALSHLVWEADARRADQIIIDGVIIGDLVEFFEPFGNNHRVILSVSMRPYSNGSFATQQGALNYMVLVAISRLRLFTR